MTTNIRFTPVDTVIFFPLGRVDGSSGGVITSNYIIPCGGWPDGESTIISGKISTPIMFPDGFKYGCGGVVESGFFAIKLNREGVDASESTWEPFTSVTVKHDTTNVVVGTYLRTEGEATAWFNEIYWVWADGPGAFEDNVTYRMEFE